MASRLPSAPPVISGFHYVRPLGTGGFADVFLFEQHMPRRPVAVKVLLANIVDQELLRMFQAEADAMAKLSTHPSILTIYEASVSADGRPYLVMEYCPSSFTSRYRAEEISLAEVLTIGVKMGSAVESAHRAGLLHRDIKPSNILITEYGTPVLSDFGIVTTVGPEPDGADVIAMSVPWSAPEVVDEREVGSVASEVWSLGATLYTLLAGVSPFEKPGRGMNQREQLKKRIVRAHYTPIARADVPESLEQTLRTAMSKHPADRFETVSEFVHELQQVQREVGLTVTEVEIAEGAWKPYTSPVVTPQATVPGPIRSTVSVNTRRVGSRDRRTMHTAVARERERTAPRGVTHAQLAWVIAGTVAVTALGVWAVLSMVGGV